MAYTPAKIVTIEDAETLRLVNALGVLEDLQAVQAARRLISLGWKARQQEGPTQAEPPPGEPPT